MIGRKLKVGSMNLLACL